MGLSWHTCTACGTSQADLQKLLEASSELHTETAECCTERPASVIFGDNHATGFLTPNHSSGATVSTVSARSCPSVPARQQLEEFSALKHFLIFTIDHEIKTTKESRKRSILLQQIGHRAVGSSVVAAFLSESPSAP